MQSKLSILELQDQLVIYSTKRPSSREAKLSAAAAGTGAAYMVYQQFGGAAAAGVALATGAAMAMMTFRTEARASHAELRVNRHELVLETRTGESVQAPRRTACFDVQWLEYRPGEADSGAARSQAGLHAVLQGGSVCVLPGLDEREAATVIERIGGKFPELREQWERRSPFGVEYLGSS
jgi:hypothetical protein